MRIALDKEEDSRSRAGGSGVTKTIPVQRAALDKLLQSQDMKQRTQLANEWADEEDRELKEKLKKHSIDDAMAFLES